MTETTNRKFLVTTPPAWTFEENREEDKKFKHGVQWRKWAWVRFSDVRKCASNIRVMHGNFSLPDHPHHPGLFSSFGHLMSDRVHRSPNVLYIFLEEDGRRLHLDVDYCHSKVDNLFVPMGWAKAVLGLIDQGIDEVRWERTDYGCRIENDDPCLFARYWGSELRQQMVNTSGNRMGWKLDGPIRKL